MGEQGAGAQMEIGYYHRAELLKEGTPAIVVSEDTGVKHFRSGKDEMGHGLPDGAAFSHWGIPIVGGDGQLVLGQELVIVQQEHLALSLLSVFEGKQPQTVALTVDADGLEHGELADDAASIGRSEQDVTTAVEVIEGLGLARG